MAAQFTTRATYLPLGSGPSVTCSKSVVPWVELPSAGSPGSAIPLPFVSLKT